MMGAFVGGLVAIYVIGLASTVLFAVAMAYLALRVQDTRKPEPDPRLGMKTAFHMIHSSGIILILVGLNVFMADIMSGAIANKPNVGAPANPFGGPPARGVQPAKGDGFNEAQRVAAALALSGLLFSVAFWAFLLGTNDHTHRSVRRVFVGGRMALCLLVTMTTVTALLVVLMQKTPSHEITEALVGTLIVWFPGACIHMVLFFAAVKEPRAAKRTGGEEDRGWRPADE